MFPRTSFFRCLDVRNIVKFCKVVVRESEGGQYNGEDGWERVDFKEWDFRLRNRNR